LQKHSGGHLDSYFDKVGLHVEEVGESIAVEFCASQKKADKESVLRYMEVQEKAVFNGIENLVNNAYKLLGDAFLDPNADWGSNSWENMSEPDYLKNVK